MMGPMEFTLVPYQDGALAHHLEVGSLLVDFILYSVTGPFMGINEELGCSR